MSTRRARVMAGSTVLLFAVGLLGLATNRFRAVTVAADDPPATKPKASSESSSESGEPAGTAKAKQDAQKSDSKPEAKPNGAPAPLASAEELARRIRQSVVVVTFAGREGQQQGLGTGFVVSNDGLIATNLHVIGEARPISVQLEDGTRFDVTEVYASDPAQDLAIVRIDVKSKNKQLVPLPLGDGKPVPDGLSVVALGNPLGLRHSVVSGVVSGTRDIEGRRMLQLAIPIEPGNSGGPVVDATGRVVGIVTMKSQVTKNLGFAVEIAALRLLLDKPNPIPLARWLTIGVIDPREWTTLFGARWQQRAGRIVTQGLGGGFGGRSLCLSKQELPELPFEVAVTVKLDDERGAAGLVFHADGQEKHFGFYPSGGKLRLSRFEGADVFTWKVLGEQPSEHYRPGDWNRLKVRIAKDGFECFVNGHLVFESQDDTFKTGQVGLAKFRETKAEFKQFRVANKIADGTLDAEQLAKLNHQIDQLPALARLDAAKLKPLAADGEHSLTAVRRRAKELTARAAELEQIARDLHTRHICEELETLVAAGPKFDLLTGALLVAHLDDEELDVESYRGQVERMAAEIRQTFANDATPANRLAALNKYLFVDNGYHGSRTDYYHRANSYLSHVIDDREGIPITLSVLYLELARRLDLTMEGVPLPGHFVVRFRPKGGDEQLIDVFERGKILPREQAEVLVRNAVDRGLLPQDLEATTSVQIVQRMLRNLIGVAQEARDSESLLRYLDALITVEPNAIAERGMRGLVRFETGRRDAAIADLDWILEKMPPDLDLDRIHEMREYFVRNRR